MELTLRPYQNDAVSNIIASILAGTKKFILHAPTGAGKTVVASRIISGARKKKKNVLFLAHRTELIKQCSKKLDEMNVSHGIIQGNKKTSLRELVQVGSVATVVNRKITSPNIIIIDECHRARAKSYEKIVNRFPEAFVLGLTATPCRTDGKGLGSIFDTIIPTTSYTELIEKSYLVPFSVYTMPMDFSMVGVKKVGGDFNNKDKTEKLAGSKIYGSIVSHWKELAHDRSTLIFCVSVEHSKSMAKSFNDIGVVAAHVDGTTKETERDQIMRDFHGGKIQVLCNVGICTEGTDIPRVSCIVLANPTNSLSLHHQMIGRGLRILPEENKQNCLILDHVGNHARLGWIDDQIEWSLEESFRANKSSKPKPKAESVRVCPKCFLNMRFTEMVCSNCGHKFKPMREAKEVKGRLVEATRGAPRTYRTNDDALTYFTKKVLQAEEKNYKRGWAVGAFRRLFNKYPSFSQEALLIRRMELTENFD